jgi:hypothetical protein
LIRKLHWQKALTAATTIVSSAPSSSSDAKSTAYETDIVDPLRASGSVTLKTEVSDDRMSNARKVFGSAVWSGRFQASSAVPTAITRLTNTRAPMGSAVIGRLGTGSRDAAPAPAAGERASRRRRDRRRRRGSCPRPCWRSWRLHKWRPTPSRDFRQSRWGRR